MSSPADTDAGELFVVGVSVESSIFTGPDTRALPVVTLRLQVTDRPNGPIRDMRVHFQASGMESIGDAIADAAVDAIAQADRRGAAAPNVPSPTHYSVSSPTADAAAEPAGDDDPGAALLRRLRTIGIEVDDVWELVESDEPYPAAIPFLLEALLDSEPTADAHFREGVVRALSIKQARPVAAPVVVHEMRRQQQHDDELVWWAFANALSVVADDSVYDDVVALARDRSFGRSREMLMDALARMNDNNATAVLVGLADDEDVDAQAVVALARRADAPLDVFERFADDDRDWVRRAARRRLAPT